VTDPWDDGGEQAPRRLGWGCLAAVIIGSVTTLIVLVIVIHTIASTL
jgi:hypothetical protein